MYCGVWMGQEFLLRDPVRQRSLYCFTWMLFYKTEVVFLLFLQYPQIWLQVSDKEVTKGIYICLCDLSLPELCHKCNFMKLWL